MASSEETKRKKRSITELDAESDVALRKAQAQKAASDEEMRRMVKDSDKMMARIHAISDRMSKPKDSAELEAIRSERQSKRLAKQLQRNQSAIERFATHYLAYGRHFSFDDTLADSSIIAEFERKLTALRADISQLFSDQIVTHKDTGHSIAIDDAKVAAAQRSLEQELAELEAANDDDVDDETIGDGTVVEEASASSKAHLSTSLLCEMEEDKSDDLDKEQSDEETTEEAAESGPTHYPSLFSAPLKSHLAEAFKPRIPSESPPKTDESSATEMTDLSAATVSSTIGGQSQEEEVIETYSKTTASTKKAPVPGMYPSMLSRSKPSYPTRVSPPPTSVGIGTAVTKPKTDAPKTIWKSGAFAAAHPMAGPRPVCIGATFRQMTETKPQPMPRVTPPVVGRLATDSALAETMPITSLTASSYPSLTSSKPRYDALPPTAAVSGTRGYVASDGKSAAATAKPCSYKVPKTAEVNPDADDTMALLDELDDLSDTDMHEYNDYSVDV